VNFLPVNDISASFNLFLTKGNKNGRLWPLFSALTIENTNNLFEILNNEKDIILLIENNYIPNIVHIENVNDFTKVYFIANQEKNILGVFDMPKFAEGFKKIPLSYYFFETIFKTNVNDFSSHKKGEVLEDISYKKLDENTIQQNKLQGTINCDKLYNIKIEQEKNRQLELEKIRKLEELKKQRQEEERIKISQEQNSLLSGKYDKKIENISSELASAEIYLGKEYRIKKTKELIKELENEIGHPLTKAEEDYFIKKSTQFLNKLAAGFELLNQMNTQSNNSSVSNSNTSSSNRNKNCSSCKGTGLCSSCQRPSKKSYLDKKCSHQQNLETKPGFIICNTCKGFGYFTTNINCDCSNGIGWCYDKECYIKDCSNGWVPCNECNYNGNGGDKSGKCKRCKGTGEE
jgi:hypothetical protein